MVRASEPSIALRPRSEAGESGVQSPSSHVLGGRDPGESLVLVDHDDRPIGTAEKLAVHRSGTLHRALSVFLFDRGGRLLLQRRAFGKYHSGGLWANACCSHPRSGETPHAAAGRRLSQELGIAPPELTPIGTCVYRAEVGGGLVEHELVHGFAGVLRDTPLEPAPEEVSETRWLRLSALPTLDPDEQAPWFAIYQDNGFLRRAVDAAGVVTDA